MHLATFLNFFCSGCIRYRFSAFSFQYNRKRWTRVSSAPRFLLEWTPSLSQGSLWWVGDFLLIRRLYNFSQRWRCSLSIGFFKYWSWMVLWSVMTFVFIDTLWPFGGPFRIKKIWGHSGTLFRGHSGSLFKYSFLDNSVIIFLYGLS